MRLFMRHDIADFTRIYANALFLVAVIALFYFGVMTFRDTRGLTDLANRAGPLCFSMILALCAYRVLRGDVRMIWTPVFWLPAQSAIFFGLGPLVSVFGNDVTVRMLNTSYLSVTSDELLWANFLSTIGVGSLLAGFSLHAVLRKGRWRCALKEQSVTKPVMSSAQVAVVFIGFAAVLKYGFVMPAQWGMLDIVVPGFLTTVTSLLDVGFAIMAFRAARGDARMRAVLLVLLPIHVFLSALTFSKNQLIVSLLFPALGDLLGSRNLRRFIVFVLGMALVYMFSQNFVHYGRDRIITESGTISQAGYVERVAITKSYFFGGGEGYNEKHGRNLMDVQGWWTRLNYAGVQVAARDLRESGVPNDSMENLSLYFIPRLIWPNKPEVLGPSWFFYKRLTGNEGTFLGLSIYGDLFWYGGWLTTVVGAGAIGWLFAMASLRSVRIIRDRSFLMFPLVLLVLQAAIFGPTKFVVTGIIAVVPMYIAYSVLMVFLLAFLRGLPLKTRSGAHREVLSGGRPGIVKSHA